MPLRSLELALVASGAFSALHLKLSAPGEQTQVDHSFAATVLV